MAAATFHHHRNRLLPSTGAYSATFIWYRVVVQTGAYADALEPVRTTTRCQLSSTRLVQGQRYHLARFIVVYILFGVDLYCLVFEMWSRRGRGRRGWCGMMCCRWILWVPPRLLYVVQEPWVTSKGLDLIGLFT